jgi:hypothetical protein
MKAPPKSGGTFANRGLQGKRIFSAILRRRGRSAAAHLPENEKAGANPGLS